ncbi:MAG: cyclic nucleotide-binding domain-containing protein [Clostridia bacterium]
MKKMAASLLDQAEFVKIGLPASDAATAVRLTFDRGEFLFREGFPIEYLMLVKRGRAKVSILVSSGKKLLLYFYGAKTVLGTVELPLGVPATTDVEATEKTECVAVPIERCRKALDTSPAFSKYITCLLAEIVVRSSRNAAVNILSSLRERLCAYIDSTQSDGIFFTNYTHLAELLGVSCRHLFRELNKLCTEGVLTKETRGYWIADRKLLVEIASDVFIMRLYGRP